MHRLNILRRLGTATRFRAGAIIYERGSPAETVYIVESGEVIKKITSPEGHEIAIQRAVPNEMIPMTSLCASGGRYQTDCTAHTDCELTAVGVPALRRALKDHHDLTLLLLNMSLRSLWTRNRQLADCSLSSVRAKLCKWLLEIAAEQRAADNRKIGVDFHYSERVIGLFLGGVSRESVSRKMSFLIKVGLIRRDGPLLTIPDPAKLAAMIDIPS